jgi:hypothetical protein
MIWPIMSSVSQPSGGETFRRRRRTSITTLAAMSNARISSVSATPNHSEAVMALSNEICRGLSIQP